ncbi:tyrosine/serine/threonine protein phosphatase pps1 [Tulasnella sp. 408]|nr:tyrosine/serine/threonine protein phosphatase pps1 [Tulasnella sp. 408]
MAAQADPVHGLQLAPDNPQILIQRPAPHAPVRSINAHQLARLVHQYNSADVEDSVLFPFLHGLEGNNIAQNSFFNYARRSDGRVRLPRYRGLVLVRVDEQGLELDIRGNVRKSTTDPKDIHHDDDEDDSDDSEAYTDDEDHVMASLDATLHMHPVAERNQRRPEQLDTHNVVPVVASNDPSSSMTSASSGSMSSNFFASPTTSSASLSQTSPPTTPNSTTDSTKMSFSSYLPANATSEAAAQEANSSSEARDRTPVPLPPPHHDVPRRPSHVLTCSFHPDELLTQTPNGAAFVTPRIPDGISLRNFGIQVVSRSQTWTLAILHSLISNLGLARAPVPIYATLSDVVVYSPRGKTRNALALAERFKQAIEAKAAERGLIVPPADSTKEPTMSPDGLVYNVYVVTDPFEVFERELPHLVGIDSKGNLVRKIEFMEREKEEMRNLTRASEIADGVFLGNTGDVPLLTNLPAPLVAPQSHPGMPATLPVYPGLDPFDASASVANVPLSRPLRILMHAGDGYTETSVLALSYIMLTGNKTLPEAYLELQVNRSRSFFVYGADVGVLRRVEQRLKLEREREREKIAASIAATAASVGSSNGSGSSTPRASATASGKDSSARGTSSPPSSAAKWRWTGLPTSWRSGSLSSAGVSLLNGAGMFSSVGSSSNNTPQPPTSIANEDDRRALFTPPSSTEEAENKVMTEPPADMGAPSRNGGILPTTASVPNLTRLVGSTAANNMAHQPPMSACALPSELVAESPSSVLDQSHHQRVVPSQRGSSLSQSYAPGQPVTVRRARASTSPMLPSFLDHETWFNDPKFDGSFPSRVLPFLYLGNLAHAGNAYMLHALGITHVVSVGECALIPPANDGYTTYAHNQSGAYQVTTGSTGTNGFLPGRPRSGSLWVEEKEGRIKVLDIKGVCDDGIDSLRPQIHPTVEWIDKARAEGGKILIHCRVGVSRSATVTIAYVMHHLNVSLVDAYLMVRSRRLSVLIQPNMRLLYNLCGWEIELARRRAAAEGRELTMSEGRQLSWPFLAREVHILNERYLS